MGSLAAILILTFSIVIFFGCSLAISMRSVSEPQKELTDRVNVCFGMKT